MRPFWKKSEPTPVRPKTSAQTPAQAPAVDLDLLAQQEEEAFVASVLKKRQELENPTPVAPPPPAPEPDEIEWSEQEDVYRPQRVHVAELLSNLALKKTPDLRKGSVCCVVRRPAYEQLQAHLRSNTRIELGGLLMGEAFYDAEQDVHIVVVEEAIPAHGGEGTARTFAYTEATWQALSPQLQALPTTWTLLGSFHSHPGLGVFLSSTDMETQRSVFYHDWQIAVVIDPISNAVGFFFGAEGHSCTHWEIV